MQIQEEYFTGNAKENDAPVITVEPEEVAEEVKQPDPEIDLPRLNAVSIQFLSYDAQEDHEHTIEEAIND